MQPKYTRLYIVKASLVLDNDAEMVSPTQARECDVCRARERSGIMLLYCNRDMRSGEHTHRSAWKCETCGFVYPGPWGTNGPRTVRLVRGRMAYEKRQAVHRWAAFTLVFVRPLRFLKLLLQRTFAAGRP